MRSLLKLVTLFSRLDPSCYVWPVWPNAAILRHLGNFSRPWALFSIRLIYCWAIFGQNSGGAFGAKPIALFSKNLGSFLFKLLVTLSVCRFQRNPSQISTFHFKFFLSKFSPSRFWLRWPIKSTIRKPKPRVKWPLLLAFSSPSWCLWSRPKFRVSSIPSFTRSRIAARLSWRTPTSSFQIRMSGKAPWSCCGAPVASRIVSLQWWDFLSFKALLLKVFN